MTASRDWWYAIDANFLAFFLQGRVPNGALECETVRGKCFFSMAHWQLDEKVAARQWYDKAMHLCYSRIDSIPKLEDSKMLRTLTKMISASRLTRCQRGIKRLAVERLEDRALLANWAVTSVGPTQEWANDITADSSGNTYLTGAISGQVQLGTHTVGAVNTRSTIVAKLDANGTFTWVNAIATDGGASIALDGSGNVYASGLNFLKKYDASGNLLLSSTVGGGDIAVDVSGNVYLAGSKSYSSTDNAAYVTKLDANLVHVWTKETSGSSRESAGAIALDSSGNPVVTGEFLGTADFNPATGKGNVNSLFSGGRKVAPSPAGFVWKLDTGGNFLWARHFQAGLWSSSHGQGIAIDANNNVYTVGYFNGSVDFDPGSGSLQIANAGNMDVYVSKLNSSGNHVWARSMGGTSQDYGQGIALDSVGDVYITGEFESTNADFDPGFATALLGTRGNHDVFASKLTSSGSFSWVGQMGGAGQDYGRAIAIHGTNNVVAAGFFDSVLDSDFDPGAGVIPLDSGSGTSGYESLFVSNFFSGAPLHATSMGTNQNSLIPLSSKDIIPILNAALDRWQAVGVDTSSLSSIDLRITDLGGMTLGLASGNTIWLDDNAAGWGWFVDATPGDDSEFVLPGNQGEQNRMDLLTVVMHELGHLLDHDHDQEGVMINTLTAGVRRTDLEPDHAALVDQVFGQAVDHHAASLFGALLDEHLDWRRPWFKRRR